MATLNEQIAAALQEGYDINDIATHLAGSENPEHQAWGQRWIDTSAQPAYQAGAGIPVQQEPEQRTGGTPVMDWASENPVAAGLGAAGAYAAMKAPGLYERSQERKIQNKKLDIEQRRLQAYEEQVARQGTGGQQAAPTQELSLREQAALETERLRQEQIKQKIAIAEAKAAREETAAKAKAEAAAAQQAAKERQNITTSGAKPSELNMVASSETAKIEKAIDAEKKAVAAQAAVPQVTAQAAAQGVPPKAGPTVALTPTPEVIAEGTAQAVSPFEGSEQVKTGTGKPAFLGTGPEGKIRSTYKDISAVPKGYAFVPGGQFIDVLRNDLSQPTYTEQFSKRGFPSVYKQEPGSAVEVAKQINRELGRETRAAMEARGVPHAEMPKPTPGILERVGGTTKGAKAISVGGVVGALVALPNLVNAAEAAKEKDITKSAGSAAQGISSFFGPLGAIAGEIFGTSPEEIELLRKAEQSKKVGAGRGIAPPESYKR